MLHLEVQRNKSNLCVFNLDKTNRQQVFVYCLASSLGFALCVFKHKAVALCASEVELEYTTVMLVISKCAFMPADCGKQSHDHVRHGR